jgi:hypothetical protein
MTIEEMDFGRRGSLENVTCWPSGSWRDSDSQLKFLFAVRLGRAIGVN